MTETREPVPSTMPWALVVSASAWMLTAVLLLVAWAGLRPDPTVDEETASILGGDLGTDAAGIGSAAPFPPFLLVVVAALLAVAGAALALRYRAARHPAVVLAVVSVVLLAVAARWETVPAMLLLVVGTIPLLLPSAVRQMR
ncbi:MULTISPECIES: hypothetical protein [unclassified Pseudonocardia]|uniref:hypothetical protein n=1 Tax=unclassified Pseudonocardia TaxID=2619320 RepID=UPI000761902F|nr:MULTISPECIES: hypothetical protein [unclassified Pseudonocardia]